MNCCLKALILITTYLNFDVRMHISLLFIVSYLEMCCWNSQEIWLLDRSSNFLDLLPYYMNFITTYMNFDIQMQFSLLFAFPKLYLKKCCLNSQEIKSLDCSFRQILAPEDIACQWMLLSLLAQSG